MSLFGTYTGTVVDNQDPLRLGRLRIRVPHVYGPIGGDFGSIANSDLPWAMPSGLPAGAQNETGGFSWPANPGDRVWVRFLDGQAEKPVWEWAMQEIEQAQNFNLHLYDSKGKPSRRAAINRFTHELEFIPTQVKLSTGLGYSITLIEGGKAVDGSATIQTPKGNMLEIDDSLDQCTIFVNRTLAASYNDLEFQGVTANHTSTKNWNVVSDRVLIAGTTKIEIESSDTIYQQSKTLDIRTTIAEIGVIESLTVGGLGDIPLPKMVVSFNSGTVQSFKTLDMSVGEALTLASKNTIQSGEDYTGTFDHIYTLNSLVAKLNLSDSLEIKTSTMNLQSTGSCSITAASDLNFGTPVGVSSAIQNGLQMNSGFVTLKGTQLLQLKVAGRTLTISAAGFAFN